MIVVKEKSKIFKAARNLEGVDVCSPKQLNAELLAPGSHPGRLAVFSEKALEEVGEKYG